MNSSKTANSIPAKSRLLPVLYIIFYVALPAVVLVISFGLQDDRQPDSFFMGMSRMLFYFVTLPIYIVYASMIFRTVGNMSSKWVFFLFVPQIVNVGWYFYAHSLSAELLDILVLDSIPTLCGLNFCFFIGLVFLIIRKSFNPAENTKELPVKILVALILIFVIFEPIIFFFIRGWHLSLTHTTIAPGLAIAKYLFSIVLVMLAHYKVIIDLYKQGKL